MTFSVIPVFIAYKSKCLIFRKDISFLRSDIAFPEPDCLGGNCDLPFQSCCDLGQADESLSQRLGSLIGKMGTLIANTSQDNAWKGFRRQSDPESELN